MEGGAGHKSEVGAVIFYVQHESFDLLESYGTVAFFQNGCRIFRNQVQNEPECTGRMGAFNKTKAYWAYGLPCREIIGTYGTVLPFFSCVEIPVLVSVDEESVVCTDRCFFQKKRIKIPTAEKPAHKVFYVRYFQCNHKISEYPVS